MIFRSKKYLLALSLPMILAACASNNSQPAQVSAQDLQHHNWQLIQVDEQNVVMDANNTQVSRLEIGEKMTANGNAGCNNFFGQAEIKDGKIRIEKMGMTMKMCPDAEMAVERAVTTTLSNWSDITLTKETMVLKNEAHTLTYQLKDWVK
ncbi:heat-shock protein HslJ [Vibrio sp. 10N.286.49.B3]|uniref:META domain-containing protein n=1 Tax=Vibrio sp. 10N.286.49.B3 TaxID=1880855 RepID=UPI000C838BED|nr:META domain-containing protein [Vibrio sp. 10N.286.49.B3]PMH46692.1 heat-shock protein HslJ [Vibrio sp. 10N.286.49.B3]